jgi:alkaline phosphatase
MSRQEPLLAPRPSSDRSSMRNAEEEDALLTGERTGRNQGRGWGFWREIGIFTWAVVATIVVAILAVLYQNEITHNHSGSKPWGPGGKPTGKRNVIFMVSDGMGPASLTLTRNYHQLTAGLPVDDVLVLDGHQIGTSRTRSTNSLVTDSAAGATAFSCGLKSYNEAISVLPDHSPCGTVLEAASLAGYKTGMVVTTRLTDATPACFASHANRRRYEDRIAEQEIGEYPLGRVVDLMFGGGRCHFLPNTTEGSCRRDERDLIAAAKDKGFKYMDDRRQFDALNGGADARLPLMGLFADTDIPYEIDRRSQADVYPSLEEMARTALKALSQATQDSDQGFFLMIEGSRIDHAGHSNDPAAQVNEVLGYDKAFTAVLDFLDEDSTPGVLVSTSDHETGGLALARQLQPEYPDYEWLPGVLANASHSTDYASAQLRDILNGREDKQQAVRDLLGHTLGIVDASDDEVDSLINTTPTQPPQAVFADMISRRAQIGWSTHGHSGKRLHKCKLPSKTRLTNPAVDVNIYASSTQDAWPLVGNNENTDVGSFLADYLDVDLDAVTKRLKSSGSWTNAETTTGAEAEFHWMGHPLDEDVRTEGLDTYHGDFRKRSNCGCEEH